MSHEPTVLLLDDEADARAELRGLLTGVGFKVVDVADGRSALHYLTSPAEDPALIVTDLAMPDMSGWEFINILQAYVRLSVIPVLVVSGVEQQRIRIRLGSVADYFRKPVNPKAFLEAVHRLTKDRSPTPSGGMSRTPVGTVS